MNCPAPSAILPEQFQGARLVYGVGFLQREDGLSGCFVLAPGWYYSDEGRARIAAAVDRWQTRLDDMQSRLDSMQTRVEAARPLAPTPHRCPVPPEHDAASFWTAGLCLTVGFVLGRLSRQRGAP